MNWCNWCKNLMMLNFPTQETIWTVHNLVCTLKTAVFSFIAIEIFSWCAPSGWDGHALRCALQCRCTLQRWSAGSRNALQRWSALAFTCTAARCSAPLQCCSAGVELPALQRGATAARKERRSWPFFPVKIQEKIRFLSFFSLNFAAQRFTAAALRCSACVF